MTEKLCVTYSGEQSFSSKSKIFNVGVAGVEAERKNWTYGVSYAYQKGGHQDSKKIIADIKMSF